MLRCLLYNALGLYICLTFSSHIAFIFSSIFKVIFATTSLHEKKILFFSILHFEEQKHQENEY